MLGERDVVAEVDGVALVCDNTLQLVGASALQRVLDLSVALCLARLVRVWQHLQLQREGNLLLDFDSSSVLLTESLWVGSQSSVSK